MKGPQGRITVFRERLENTGLGSRKKPAESSTERESLPQLPAVLLIWAGWLMGRPGDGNNSLQVSGLASLWGKSTPFSLSLLVWDMLETFFSCKGAKKFQ